MSSTATPLRSPETREAFDAEVREDLDAIAFDARGWFCVATAPFPCPAVGCDFVAHHMTAAHLIVVWPSQDDRALLNAALRAREAGRDPRVTEYEPSMGPCIPWDAWHQIGSPVHGQHAEPEGWGAIPNL